MRPNERPSAAQIYNTFSKFGSVRKAVEGLPDKLELQIQSIEFSLNEPKKRQVYVKLNYGNNVHTTKEVTAGGEYTWFVFRQYSSSPQLLSLRQGHSGNLVDRTQQASHRAQGLPQSAPGT